MSGRRLLNYNLITIFLAVFEFALILCVPLVNIDGSPAQRSGAYILAAVFWICITAECVFTYLSTRERRRIEQREYQNKDLTHSPPGVVSFFKNSESTVADVILFVSSVLIAVLLWARVQNGWLIITGISFLFLSFNLHCILNGKNYRYLKTYRHYEKEHEQDE